MAHFNLDKLLAFREDETNTFEDEHPNAGIPQATFSQDHFEGPQLAMFYKTHRGVDLYDTFTVGGWEKGNYHRKVCQGPRVNGPHAWMSKNATALTAHKQEERQEILVQPGDTVTLRGTTYEITQVRGYAKLEPVA